MDGVARAVLPLLLRGIGLRSDALNSVLDDMNLPSTVASSSELHVARYRGPVHGKRGAANLELLSHRLCGSREGKLQPGGWLTRYL